MLALAVADVTHYSVAQQQLIAERLNDFLDAKAGAGYPHQLGPQAAALDRRVHTVELALRDLVRRAIEEDASVVPSHVSDNVERRYAAEARRNPGSVNGADGWDAKVSYFDLSELKDVIMGGAAWPRFEGRFGSKDATQARFGQLAALRNVLRHSRQLDDVTRQDGLAALGWFDAALRR